jgi:peptidoglycan/LPS O-acetylase OafA/YrhL
MPQPKSDEQPRERMLELDAMRGLTALMVVLFHYTTQYENYFGHSGVVPLRIPYDGNDMPRFFVISGFVILMTLERTNNWLDFVVSRIARLYPVYWVAVACTFGAMTLFPLPGIGVGVPDMLVNLTMLQGHLQRPHVDGVYWTMTVELSFYGVMLALYIAGQLRRIEQICWAWLALALAAHAAAGIDALWWLLSVGKLFLVLEFANLFVSGIVFHISRRERRWTAGRHALLGACVLLQGLTGSVESMVLTGAFVGMFYAHAFGKLRWLAIRPLVFLGTVSYALFLTHQHIGWIIINRLESRGADPLFAICVALAFALALATILTFVVEKPAQRAIRGRYALWKAARTGAPRPWRRYLLPNGTEVQVPQARQVGVTAGGNSSAGGSIPTSAVEAPLIGGDRAP